MAGDRKEGKERQPEEVAPRVTGERAGDGGGREAGESPAIPRLLAYSPYSVATTVAAAGPGRRLRAGFCACPPPPSRSGCAGERGEQAACHCWCPAPARSARPAVPTGPARHPPIRPPRGRDAAAPAYNRATPQQAPRLPPPTRAPRGHCGEPEPSARELSALRRPRPAVCRGGPGEWGRVGPGASPPGGGGLQGLPSCPVNPSATAVGGGWEVAWAHTCRLRRGRGAAGKMRAAVGAASGGSASPQPPEL
ncbi:unnamed protein product [Rangifer tarandus platyrhynchus]|uniref:Uncharacterized protein n=1 Tax=Rangifer tarandus platyrhynchus TaxID=3082113 RepID=A0ABN8Z8F1_RANTA|nr:unnamed protein product [Rangifer tarandus platyrhynchus]